MPDAAPTHPSHPVDASFTGTCEVALTRAVIPYRDPLAVRIPGGRIGDLGMGLVLENHNASRSRVLDLGSGEVRAADLTGPIVILGWVFPSHFRALVRKLEEGVTGGALGSTIRSTAMRLLGQAGFSPLTLPVHLRVAFRDLCQDLDLHEGTSIRVRCSPDHLLGFHLEYEATTLVVGLLSGAPSERFRRELGRALADAFPHADLLRPDAAAVRSVAAGGGTGETFLSLRLPVPRSLAELNRELQRLRRGFLHLLARYEAERYRTVQEAHLAFGARNSLGFLGGEISSPPRIPTRLPPPVPSQLMGLKGVH